MKSTARIILLAAVLIPSTTVPSEAELSLEGYIQLTIARLELIETAWRETGEPPPEQELDEIYPEHGTDREAYFCFSGENRKRIKAYLDRQTELRDRIESLSASIQREIAQREPR